MVNKSNFHMESKLVKKVNKTFINGYKRGLKNAYGVAPVKNRTR